MNFHVGRGRLNMCKIPWRNDLNPMEGHVALGTNRSPRNAWLWVRGPYNLVFNSAKNAEPFIPWDFWNERNAQWHLKYDHVHVFISKCAGEPWCLPSIVGVSCSFSLQPVDSPTFNGIEDGRTLRRDVFPYFGHHFLQVRQPNDHMIYSDGGLFKQNLSYQTTPW